MGSGRGGLSLFPRWRNSSTSSSSTNDKYRRPTPVVSLILLSPYVPHLSSKKGERHVRGKSPGRHPERGFHHQLRRHPRRLEGRRALLRRVGGLPHGRRAGRSGASLRIAVHR